MTARRNLSQGQITLLNSADADAMRCAATDRAEALARRTTPGIAPIEPSVLMGLFADAPASAWAALAPLTDAQLVNQAIEVATWLEQQMGRSVRWSSILDKWSAHR